MLPAALHCFLMAAVATAARPDAVHDISTKRERGQWHSHGRILSLNRRGRRQTKKYRATVKAPWQFALRLDETDGYFVGVKSVRQAHDAICDALRWTKDGENGLKLWRRSVAQLLRGPAGGVPAEQIELQSGHRRLDSITDLYAAFDSAFLKEATAARSDHRRDRGPRFRDISPERHRYAPKVAPIGASVNA